MIKLDDNLLQQLGLGDLPEQERKALLRQMYDTLELRVGMTIAEQMTEEQLDEFEAFMDAKDQQGALRWLETNFPDYKKVVANEMEKLKNEVARDAEQIKSSVGGGQAPAPQQTAPPQQPPAAPSADAAHGQQQAPAAPPPQSMPPQQPPSQAPPSQPGQDQNQ